MRRKKLCVTEEQAREFVKSPECLLAYLLNTWRKRDRKILLGSNGLVYVECPSKSKHAVTQSGFPKSFHAAQVIRERGTGKGYLHCDICGGTWDVVEVFAIDHFIKRPEALDAIKSAMYKNYKIIDGVQFEEVDDIHDIGGRETRLDMAYDGFNLCSYEDYGKSKVEFERESKQRAEQYRLSRTAARIGQETRPA